MRFSGFGRKHYYFLFREKKRILFFCFFLGKHNFPVLSKNEIFWFWRKNDFFLGLVEKRIFWFWRKAGNTQFFILAGKCDFSIHVEKQDFFLVFAGKQDFPVLTRKYKFWFWQETRIFFCFGGKPKFLILAEKQDCLALTEKQFFFGLTEKQFFWLLQKKHIFGFGGKKSFGFDRKISFFFLFWLENNTFQF